MTFLERVILIISWWLQITVMADARKENCTFDIDLCGWINEKQTDMFDWRRAKSTSTLLTGPSRDVSGNGYFIYIESSDRNGRPGDIARLRSPPLNGTQCMTFYYNFYGKTMSCVVIYIQTADGSEKIVWIKSGHWGDRWIKTQIEMSEEKANYSVIIEGIRGSTHLGDAALDEFRFIQGPCKHEPRVFHVASTREENREVYQVHSFPAHDQWLHKFEFTAYQSLRTENDTMMFIYPASRKGKPIISTTPYLKDFRRFPYDFFIAKRNNATNDIFELSLSSNSSKISISNKSDDCCLVVRTAKIPVIQFPERNRSCFPGWIPVGPSCLRFFVNTRRTWDGARSSCRQQGGDLALEKNTVLFSSDFMRLLRSITHSETDFFVGFRRTRLKHGVDAWIWNDGKSVGDERWKNGYPLNDDKNTCGALSRINGKLVNNDCASMNGFICESWEVDIIKYQEWTQDQPIDGQESLSLPNFPLYSTSFYQSKMGNPRWIITLVRRTFVFKVTVDLFVDCCDEPAESVTLFVTDDNSLYSECDDVSISYNPNTLLLKCTPPKSGKYVILDFVSYSNSPASSATVSAVDSVANTHGAHRELWYRYVNTEGFTTLRENPIFDQPPEGDTTALNMSSTFEVSENYGERLTSYLQVPESANYTFTLSCGDECELWLKQFRETQLSFETNADSQSGQEEEEVMLVQLQRWASYNQSDTCLKKQATSSLFLNKCQLYTLNVYMKEEQRFKCLSVGMSGPKAIEQEPIQGKHLFVMPPGTRTIDFTLLRPNDSIIKQVDLGSVLRITASYKYCCQGIYCPDCPISLEFHAFGKSHLVNPSVKLTCSEEIFQTDIEVITQPGKSSMEIHYSFTNDVTEKKGRRKIVDVNVKVATVTQLTFSEDDEDWTVKGWKISGGHGVVNEHLNSWLESAILPWKPFYEDVGLCLHFKFQLPTKFLSSLKVFIKTSQENILIWKLRGYQGNKWNNAKVAWKPQDNSQIVIQGFGAVNGTPSILIDNIVITTETCALSPSHASPDFVCSPNEFQCHNGECISLTFRCDSDINCIDGSDEDGCTCLTVELPCSSGDCVSSANLCNGINDCSDGKDERFCGTTCTRDGMFQCADGTCIPWSSTCRHDNTLVCRDDSQTPVICGATDCPLNHLNCKEKMSVTNCDKHFKGQCTFENGFCGLKHDNSVENLWILHSGLTPSAETGPKHDHTTYSEKGAYIYMEASQRQTGDRVRLMSEWMEQNKIFCLQFWYHMFGKHTGQLNVYIATNSSETLAWSQSGNQGDKWMFAQTTLQAKRLFKFILEGVTSEGSKGDIAVDDVTVLEEECHIITKMESPHCYFDASVCNWKVDKQWLWTEHKTGGYLSLESDGSKLGRRITSPLFIGKDWRCMRFWYKISMGHKAEIKAFINSSSTTKQLWKSAYSTSKWSFVQLPINTNGTARVIIEGVNSGTSIDFDDVSFSKHHCREIPWLPYQEFLPPLLPGCLSPLGMQDGRIPDSAIGASSYYRARSAPTRGRLHLAIPDALVGFTGGWCQYPSSKYYQFLQVDFGFVASVGKVATQGKQELDFWVTKYFLTYRHVGSRKFLLYRQQGNVKVFDGNFDRHTVVSHLLIPRITSQFVRIYAYRYRRFGCLRVEYYGCAVDQADEPKIPCYSPLGMQNGQIPNASITASSDFGSAYRARLHTVKEGGKPGAWVAASADSSQWLQVDHGALVMIRGLATQGRHEAPEWVSSFVLSYSSMATNFRFHEVNSTIKIFTANNNQNTVAVNTISPSILCRYLRVHPRTWVNNVALRIEIFGCLAVNMNVEKIEDIGCYKDTPDRAMPLLEAMSQLLDSSYLQRAAAIRRCAEAAFQLKLDDFAVQNGGQCFGGPRANLSYKKYGSSTQCPEDGRGGPWANQVYRINKRCNSSVEWCGWTSHDDAYPMWNINIAENLNRAGAASDAHWGFKKGNQHDRRYMLETHGNRYLHMAASVTSSQHITELTVCYWLQDNNATLSLVYTSTKGIPSFRLYQNFTGLRFSVMGTSILSSVSVTRHMWHHICVSWSSQGGFWKIYKNGRLFDFDRWLGYGKIISGTGTVSVSFQQNNESLWSRLSGVNLWNYEIAMEQIYRLSLGCGDETGNLLNWFDLKSEAELTGHVLKLKDPSCTHREDVMSIVGNGSERRAVLESPWFNRSAQGYGKCLQFRFLIFGAGAKMLEIHQEIDAIQRRIWKDSNNTVPHWRYGQVSFTSVTRSKIIIKGELGRLPGYIAVGGLSWADGYCGAEPPLANSQACSKNLVKSPGFISSPYHPGLYAPNSQCNWLITAPVGHVVRLEFLDFQLEYNPRCATDFMQVMDGQGPSAQTVGSFCGENIPTVIETSTNTALITFRSDENIQRNGFKLLYSFRGQTEDKICASKRDCPSGCSCFKISDIPKKFAVQGYDLRTVPRSMPSYTTALLFANNRINQIQEKALSKLPLLEYIDLSHNVILVLADYSFHDKQQLKNIKLTGNFIRKLTDAVFSGLDSLEVLELGENLLSEVPKGAFSELPKLRVLSLRSNEIKVLEKGMFSQRNNLTYLYLQHNLIESIPDKLFKDLGNLKVLFLNKNKIKRISMSTFDGLSSLEIMYLDYNKIVDFHPEAFHSLENLKILKMDHFTYCCYAVKAIPQVDCQAPADGFSSCDDLMKNRTLQIFIWLLGILAFLGNAIVIAWRCILREDNRVHSFLLTNLAISDFLMGLYLLIIAIKDAQWQGEYFKHDFSWRTGKLCQFAGVLSMVSSEVSVAMLTIITADRLVCIVFPFRFKRLSLKRVFILCAIVWLLGIITAIVPLTGIAYFIDNNTGFGFYGRSAVCLPLQLSSDRPAGWEYSVSFFIAFNFLAFMFMLVAYIAMFITAKRIGGAVRSTSVRRETAMAGKMMFIILTDFFCWMPVIIIGVLSLTGNLYDPKQQVYVWIAVFVLPVNSSINPLLYTFSTTSTRKKLKTLRGTMSTFITKNMFLSEGTRSRLDQNNTRLNKTLSSVVPNLPDDKESPGRFNLKIIEICNIFHKRLHSQSIGYLTSWVESDMLEMCLIKYFTRSKEKDWVKEVEVLSEISKHGEHANLMSYCWHSEASALNIDFQTIKMPFLKSNGLFICFSFVSSTTLEDFLKESTELKYEQSGLLSVMLDVIKAVEHLHKIRICHNDVSPSSVLISFSEGVQPIKGVLGSFGQAFVLKHNGNCCMMFKEDIRQFGKMMETVVSNCTLEEASEIKVKQILRECGNEEEDRKDATCVKKSLQAVCNCLEENTRL